ncbi:M6 family metalloprotease domain-containing protein [Clostridium sp. CTA-19]
MKKGFLSKLGLATLVAMASVLGTSQPQVNAAPMKDAQVNLTQPDGQVIQCYASGDEFYNYLHDVKGRAILKDEKTGYYVYGKYVKDEILPSRERVTKEKTESLQDIENDSRININDVEYPKDEIEKQREMLNANVSTKSTKNIGKLNNIVIFIKFSDQYEITRNFSTYDRQFNSENQASLNNYYKEASYNKLDINTTFYPKPQGDKVLSYTDSHPRSYYANVPDNERGMREQTLLKNAVDSVKNQIPQDLNVDSDNDGKVDNVCFIIKGATTGWSSLLWPHKWNMFYQDARINGKKIDTYNFQLEDFIGDNGIGVLSHEMFHTLGAPDLYHYNYDGKVAVGPWDVMDQTKSIPQSMGTYMKMYYGKWMDNIQEINKPGKYSVSKIGNSNNNSYIIKSPNSNKEYFVVEYRKKERLYESNLPGEGLLVYRINTAFQGRGNASGNDEVYLYRPYGTLNAVGDLSKAALGYTKININSNELFLSNGMDSGISLQNVNVSGDTANFNVVINGETGDGDNKETAYLGEKFNFTFKGYADKVFGELGLDLANKNAKFDIKGIMPHYYFEDSYASLLIRDSEGNTVYTKDFTGNEVNEALVEDIPIQIGDYITVKHREPDNRLLITNTENKLQLEKGSNITYKITNTGLEKTSEDEIEKLPLKYAVNFDDTKTITGDMEITGECVSGKKITNIELYVNGGKYIDAERSALNDTQKKYVGYDLSQGAFKLKLYCSAWADYNYSYKIIATEEDGQKTTLKEGTLIVKKQTGGTDTEKVSEWKPGTTYKVGDLVTYKGNKYKCRQAHRAIVSWEPEITLALWSIVY